MYYIVFVIVMANNVLFLDANGTGAMYATEKACYEHAKPMLPPIKETFSDGQVHAICVHIPGTTT